MGGEHVDQQTPTPTPVTPAPTPTPTPTPTEATATTVLTGTDINNASPAGSTTDLGGGTAFNVIAGGKNIDGSSDSFHFSQKQLSGDFDIRIKVQSLDSADGRVRGGLMVRKSLDANSKMIFAGATKSSGYRVLARTSTGGSAGTVYSGGTVNFSTGVWLRLKHSGDTYNAYTSTNGTTWTKVGSKSVSLGSTVYVGLATASRTWGIARPRVSQRHRPDRRDADPDPTPTPTPTPTTTPSINWTKGPEAPYKTQESTNVQIGNKIYMWGGFTDNEHATTTHGYVLNMDTNQWSTLPDAPGGQTHVGVAADDQGRFIYMVGGIDDTGHRRSIDAAYRYDVANKTFQSFPKLPQVRVGGAMAIVDGWLHYFGGDLGSDRVTPTRTSTGRSSSTPTAARSARGRPARWSCPATTTAWR